MNWRGGKTQGLLYTLRVVDDDNNDDDDDGNGGGAGRVMFVVQYWTDLTMDGVVDVLDYISMHRRLCDKGVNVSRVAVQSFFHSRRGFSNRRRAPHRGFPACVVQSMSRCNVCMGGTPCYAHNACDGVSRDVSIPSILEIELWCSR